MKVLVSGADGFIAKNLIISLSGMPNLEIIKFTKHHTLEELEDYLSDVDFVFHLAGVNRPVKNNEFYSGNVNLTEKIVEILQEKKNYVPILFSSSSQVGKENDYSKSKELAESIIIDYSKKTNTSCFIYRLPNVFGKWSRPNYNSVIATWCYNITRDIEIQVSNAETKLELVYIGDVVHAFLDHLYVTSHKEIFCDVKRKYIKTLGEIKELLYQFKESRKSLLIPKIAVGFERVLYATYLSYLPTDKFSYTLEGHQDVRGTFYEILKTKESGQLGISTTVPGVTRGNHYHNTKNEKFLVLKGKALIELREVFSDEIVRYEVSDAKMEIVEMIPGYTHNITNIGDEDMVLLIWANENYNPQTPDTNFKEV